MLHHFLKSRLRLLVSVCLGLIILNLNFISPIAASKDKTSPDLGKQFASHNPTTSSSCPAADQSKDSQHPPRVVSNDGDYLVTTSNAVLNNYAVLAVDAGIGDGSIQLTNAADLDSSITELGALAPGDLLIIIQMQGAGIDTSNSVAYGAVTAINGAGLYEFVTVDSIVGNTINLETSGGCGVLRNAYSAAGRTQIVRVPQFNNLTVDPGASVTASAWDGQRGGVIALIATGTLTLNGTINAAAIGFRGGALDTNTSVGITDYVSGNPSFGAEKGEGIAGDAAQYDSLGGRYGRGAAANGGGGGNARNAAGGGGANGNNNNTWNGQGVMNGAIVGAAAWALDPGYIANGNALTNSSGGGRGGRSLSNSDADALTVPPGDAGWGGDRSSEVGGLGGRPVDNNAANRLYLGGGGGAGDANSGAGGAGGNGGGLAFVIGNTITGSGSITANGENGHDTVNCHCDGPGGGGGGGTVIASAAVLNGISITARGGNGGNQFHPVEAEGGGGGGGGGYIATIGGTIMRIVSGGQSGTTTSSYLSEFPSDGATDGAAGVISSAMITFPICGQVVTASEISVSGRIMTSSGRGIGKAFVKLTDSFGETRTVVTNPFGYYSFPNISGGQTYILSVSDKRYHFDNPSQLLTTSEDREGVNFVAQH